MMPVKGKLGDSPVILCEPHKGIFLPNALMARLNEWVRVAQCTYLAAEATPWTYSHKKAEPMHLFLKEILQFLDKIAHSGVPNS
jgi:N-formylglutamate amidohydrolase